MCRGWKFDQKPKFGTWIHILIFFCRIIKKHVSIKEEMSFMSFKWICVNAIQSQLVSLMGVRWAKFFYVWTRVLWVEKESDSEWKVWVFTLRKVLLLEKLRWNGKTYQIETKSSFLKKLMYALNPRILSHSPNDKWWKWDSWGRNEGVIYM